MLVCPPSHARPHVPGVVRKERAMHEFNQAKSDAFVGKMIDIVNHAALALMTSIGRQTGLLEVMAVLTPLRARISHWRRAYRSATSENGSVRWSPGESWSMKRVPLSISSRRSTERPSPTREAFAT